MPVRRRCNYGAILLTLPFLASFADALNLQKRAGNGAIVGQQQQLDCSNRSAGFLDDSSWWTPAERNRAYEPLGHVGARQRLQSKLLAASAGEPIHILVLGGSMTYGGRSTCKWSDVLKHTMAHRFKQVTVSNFAKRGSTSASPLLDFDEILRAKPDVVLVDYAVNDGFSMKEDGTPDSTKVPSITKDLVTGLLALPSAPAVVYVETFSWFHAKPKGYSCFHNISDFPHWPALVDLDVPVVSYSGASCIAQGQRNTGFFKHWVADDPHPPCPAHKELGHLVGEFFADVASQAEAEACQAVATRSDHPVRALQAPTGYKCFAHPSTKLFSTHLFEDTLKSPTLVLQNAFDRFPASYVDKHVWQLGMDVAGRADPGWIAAPGAPGEIEFRVKTSGEHDSLVFVEYLKTYNNIGTAQCWFKADPQQLYRLNGRREAHVSLSEVATLSAARLPAGNNFLRCRSDGAKFKIIKVVSC